MTDRKGRFTFATVPDGSYSFRLTKIQFQTVEGTVVVQRKRRFPSPFNFTLSSVDERVAVAEAQGTAVHPV
jgi:hypothetical protein